MPSYEYLVLTSATTTNWADIAHLPDSGRPEATWTVKQWIWRPGAEEAEERSEQNIASILSELGRDGWRLINFTHPTSRISVYSGKENNLYGFFGEIGMNMDTRYVFMREEPS
jgi:hypothetical protein